MLAFCRQEDEGQADTSAAGPWGWAHFRNLGRLLPWLSAGRVLRWQMRICRC